MGTAKLSLSPAATWLREKFWKNIPALPKQSVVPAGTKKASSRRLRDAGNTIKASRGGIVSALNALSRQGILSQYLRIEVKAIIIAVTLRIQAAIDTPNLITGDFNAGFTL